MAEIFEQDGEADVSGRPRRVPLPELGDMAGPLVVSVGGGAVLAEANRRRHAGARDGGLAAGPPGDPGRAASAPGSAGPCYRAVPGGPGGATAPHDVLARLDGERRALYEEVADLVVDVDDLSAPQVARRVADALAERRARAAGRRPG